MTKSLSQVNLDSIVHQSPEQVHTRLDDDTILMSIKSGSYFSMNDFSARIWKLIETPVRVSVLCKHLVETFDVSLKQCEKDVLAFFNDLNRENLLSIIDNP